MNILITAIGSMSADTVISCLKKNKDHSIIGCDINPAIWIPTSEMVDDFYQVPDTSDENLYVEKLKSICLKTKASFIIPLTDPEVDVLAETREEFKAIGVTVLISNTKTIQICRSKVLFYNFFKDDPDIQLIPTYTSTSGQVSSFNGSIIAKPANGRSSEGFYKIDNINQSIQFLSSLKNYVFQPYLDGDIYTVDLVRNAFTGEQVSVSRRELIRTKNGAGVSVKIIESGQIDELVRKIGDQLDINGAVNIEFLKQGEQYYLMDINPRFSAGIEFTNLAGYDIVNNHLNCFTGHTLENLAPLKLIYLNKKYITMERHETISETSQSQKLSTEADWNSKWGSIFDHYQQDLRHAYYIQALLDEEDNTLLEMGAGSFRDMAALNGFGLNCYGSDFSSESVRLAKERFPLLSDKIVQRDAFNTGFNDNEFDVTFHNGLWVLFSDEDILKMATEQARITKRKMMITVHNAHNKDFVNYFEKLKQKDPLYDIRFFEIGEMKSLLKQVSSNITVVPVGKGKKHYEDQLINLGYGHPEVLKMVFQLAGLSTLEQSERLIFIAEL